MVALEYTQKTKQEDPQEKQLKQLRQDILLNFTASALSLYNTDNVEKLKANLALSHTRGRPHISVHVAFGIDDNEDKKTKQRMLKEALVQWFCQTLDRLWARQSDPTTSPIERKIITMCQESAGAGRDKETVLNTVCKHFGLEIPDKPAPVATLP